MKASQQFFTISILLCLVFVYGFDVKAQSKRDAYDAYRSAVEMYNQGLDLSDQSEYQQAISRFTQAIESSEKAIEICNQLEADDCVINPDDDSKTDIAESANGIKDRANDNLPRLYYQKASQTYKNKEYLRAVELFKEAQVMADSLGNSQIARRSKANVYKLYFSIGNSYLKKQQFDEAQKFFNKSLEVNPENAKVYYHKAIMLKKEEQPEKAMEMYDKAIEMAINTNDSVIERKATEAARDFLVYRGANNVKDKQFETAIELLERALEYDNESEDAYFWLASVYNNMSRWDAAIEHANSALKFETGSKTDRAKIYFELGMALKQKGNKSGACDAFADAAYGNFQSRAEYEMKQELECEQATQSN